MGASPFTSVQEATSWLDAHINYESSMPTRRALPTLERMRALMSSLGDPERSYPSIHVTGTNGKGSTAAMITSLLGAMGLGVGTYSSPNLSRVNERLSYGGAPIDDEAFTEAIGMLSLVEPQLEVQLGERLTRFELLTAAALRWFCDLAVDVAVVEVGLGGTWDCTNVVDGQVAVVTNISFDHTDVLGPTLAGIAHDKAGIVKPGSTAVIGETDAELVGILRTAADGAGAREVWVRGEEFTCTADRLAAGGRLVDIRTPCGSYPDVYVPLHGPHQADNAACALAAVESWLGSSLDAEVVRDGFGAVEMPGRLEVVGRRPLFLVDGAHNVAGMQALARALGEGFSVEGDAVAVVGMLAGRDPVAMLEPLRVAGISSVVTCAPRSPRAIPTETVARAARAVGLPVTVAGEVSEALAVARSSVTADGLVLVTGSLYVVADARELMVGTVPRT